MFRLLVTSAFVVMALVAVKDEHVLERAKLVGTCDLVESAPDGAEWLACHSGTLVGYPDLSRDACVRHPSRTSLELWRCPASLVVSRDIES